MPVISKLKSLKDTFMMACLKVLFGQLDALDQGSSNLSLEDQSAAEFNSNPDQTHLPVMF